MKKKWFIFLIPIIILWINFNKGFTQQLEEEQLTIVTYYPAPYGVYRDLKVEGNLEVDGDLFFNETQTKIYRDTSGRIAIQASGVEVKDLTGELGVVRLRNVRFIPPNAGVSTCINYSFGATTYCPDGYYAIACGGGNCNSMGSLSDPSNCPRSGWMICVKGD
jgi:hypothetical protein